MKIKLKCWHKKQKMFFPIIAIGFADGWIELEPAPDSSFIINIEDVELVQFTGLYDKNGREIYESDIITYQECIYQVVYMETKACFSLDGVGQYKHFMDIMATIHTDSMVSLITEERFTIIGNIYENPELLEVNK